jgi:glycosyltransferase involved in cell wall biosynthesis
MISIVIPTFNEISHGYIEEILKSFSNRPSIEIICVDSESRDGTVELIKKYDVKLIQHKTNSRGERLTVGAKAAINNLIILHHPRSILEVEALDYLIKNQEKLVWGGFTHKFDLKHPLLNFTSWYSNYVRADIKGIFYLDHCFYIQKDLLAEIDYLPSIDIFEDTVLSQRLLSKCRPRRLPFKSRTSAVRFNQNGVWRQALLNLWMKILFSFNTNNQELNKKYEKDVPLNSKY